MQRLLAPAELGPRGAVAMGVIIGVCGQLSDLAESLVKRAVGAKDSGNLLPGHGGIMDRFDSFILAAPAVYYFLTLK
jgi:phosphatidate cytidylyltransferase